ncbi:MAG: exodeoxyribonuclease VII large subunit [Akkermansiaceae bacterium]
MADNKALTVTRLVRRMRNLLEIELGEIWVEGEISNLRRQASGHCYFSLKDDGAQISCVLFRGNAARAKAKPEDGMQARLFGEVSVYEARGQVQLIVRQVEDAGMGDLQARFEALKRKLDSEGLFDQSTKKSLPAFPRKIALVTSPTGAALQDMLNVLGRRAPWVEVYNYPVQVQGKGAERGIARAIHELDTGENHNLPEIDVIIVGRGGGSLEDLWNFNEECVARAIHACQIPIVSAVGHEIDFTIADFAADVRAPTPSAAAELVVPDAVELRARIRRCANGLQGIMESRLKHDTAILKSARRALMPKDSERALREPIQELDSLRQDLKVATTRRLEECSSTLKQCAALHATHHPQRVIERRIARVQELRAHWQRAGTNALERSKERFRSTAALIQSLGPSATLARGYSVTTNSKGDIVTDSTEVKAGEKITTKLAQGKLESIVQDQDQE